MTPIVSESYKENKKKEILESAFACFAKKGFEAATVDDIVAHANISKGSIYNYFKSKDEIYLALMTQDTSERYLELKEELSKYATAVERLNYFFGEYLKLDPFSEKTRANVLVHYEFKLHASRNQELNRKLKARRKEYFIDLVGDLILDGQIKGELDRDLDSRLYAEVFWAMVDGVTLQTVYDDFPYHEVLRQMQELFLGKIRVL